MESRRPNTNLSYLTLSPITSRLPLDDNGDDGPEIPTPWAQRTSYISGKSAPSTPKILSRSSSRTRLDRTSTTKLASSKSYTHLATADPNSLARSKSTTQVALPSHSSFHHRKKSSKSSTRLSKVSTDNGEWLFRAGAAISSEAREYKGQSWLVSRDSSTSLVAQHDDDDETTDDNDTRRRSVGTPSARASRGTSRVPSARTSRRGSRVGSKPDLSFFSTPAGGRTPAAGRVLSGQDMGDYFGRLHDPAVLAGPDFVDQEDFDDEDSDETDEEEERRQEAEIKKLASDRGFGLGSVVDKLLGWTLFDVQDDGLETDDEDSFPSQTQEAARRKEAQPKAKIQSLPPRKQANVIPAPAAEETQAWSDAAWLLSVASKVLL